MNHKQDRRSVAAAVRARVEHVLSTRRAAHGTFTARVEEQLKRGGSHVWSFMERHPAIGVTAVGGLALAVATAVGAAEVVLAATAAYGAYQVLREGARPGDVLKRRIESVEREELG